MSFFRFGQLFRQNFACKSYASQGTITTHMDGCCDKNIMEIDSHKVPKDVEPRSISSQGSTKPKIYGEVMTDSSKTQKLRPTTTTTTTPYDSQKWFPVLEGKSEGRISAKELQNAFKLYQNKHFSDNVCKFVVRLFDLDKNGGVDIREFEQIYTSVKQWVSAFNTCDRARSGFLTDSELDLALKQMDINFSPDFVTFLINRCDPVNKKMSLDQFIVTCVQMQKYTDEFRARDEKSDGVIKLRYEDFLELLMKTL